MNLADIPKGARIFADANILSYALSTIEPLHTLTAPLLERSARREIELLTSSFQAAHVIHRAMVVEARHRYQLSSREVVSYLKQHPDAVRSLTRYKQIPGEFSRARINILDVTYREIHASKQFRDDFGLLTDDSITLAVMRRHSLADLASNDEDFKRVTGIRLWTPD
ncbi:MAG: type II toxin-antitoxin system VapC family toxin [Anaerolineae bacterium]